MRCLPGTRSLTYSGRIGDTVPATDFPRENVIDTGHTRSEGYWAFCRFDHEEVYAARMGFQRGGIDITDGNQAMDPQALQLHLELMTGDGALIWLGTGKYRAEQLNNDPTDVDVQLRVGSREIFRIQGWPQMNWHFESDDGLIEATLAFEAHHVTLLPDAILPRVVFSMWETSGPVVGTLRHADRQYQLAGTVFYDHPRVRIMDHPNSSRQWYLYTPVALKNGSTIISYYAEDRRGAPLDYYCFAVHTDPNGKTEWFGDLQLTDCVFDADALPCRWTLRGRNAETALCLSIDVRPTSILKMWGTPQVPTSRKEFVFIPLVLDGNATFESGSARYNLTASGLAEYWRA
ncbi:MAG: hypothetical protein GX620_05655 [Chloroflexi bacterium]|nr:hypothetical protein [Chloroflexota bacterium]